MPALIADLGEDASWRYTEFFSANISNPNTRRAYARACSRFLAWCDDRGLTLTQIRPHDVATYIAEDLAGASAPNVKQQPAAVRMMFDWLVVGQMMPSNPATSVRGPKYVVKTGKTPVLEGDEWRRLIDSIPTRDRARPARPCADRHPHLWLCARHGSTDDEGRGSPATRRGLVESQINRLKTLSCPFSRVPDAKFHPVFSVPGDG